MIRDVRLAELRGAVSARATATQDLQALPLAPDLAEGGGITPGFAAVQARWLEQARARANARLAAARAAEMDSQAAAARAVGRADVLRRLASGSGRS